MSHNYVQYIYSYVPQDEPGGGGFTVMIQSLNTLWEDWQHLKNIWTQSNAALPLVRYRGVTFTFWQTAYTDYCVQVTNCLPMLDTKWTHADSAPSRMLLKKHIIKVPSRETQRRKKPYKRVRIKPPPQFTNKWYFQKDICNIPLAMIVATAVDFRYPFCSSNCKSNNLSLVCLNTQLFQFHNFDNKNVTTGYTPKPGTYLYAPGRGTTQPSKPEDLIYLGDTKNNTPGKPGNITDPKNWGNPFWHHYIDDSIPVYSSTKSPSEMKAKFEQPTELAEPYFFTVRYNPEKDTGSSNTIYLVSNFQHDAWDPPLNPNLKMDGFPLYLLCWGAIDWFKKLHEIQDLDHHYIFCIQTDIFDEKKRVYVPLDVSYRTGFGPYETTLNNYDKTHFYPQVRFQDKSINDICLTGPGCARSPYGNYLEAKMSYKFNFNWGGCPKVLEKPYDPCSQPDWIVPRNFYEGLSVQDPNTPPQTEIQKWDWSRDYIKQTAIERIQQYTEPYETLQISTGTARDVPILRQTQEKDDETTDSEEEKTPIQIQLKQLRKQQQQLKLRILRKLTLESYKL